MVVIQLTGHTPRDIIVKRGRALGRQGEVRCTKLSHGLPHMNQYILVVQKLKKKPHC